MAPYLTDKGAAHRALQDKQKCIHQSLRNNNYIVVIVYSSHITHTHAQGAQKGYN